MKIGVRTRGIVVLVVFTMMLVMPYVEASNLPPIPGHGFCNVCYGTVYVYPSGNQTTIWRCGVGFDPVGFRICVPDVNGCYLRDFCIYA